MKVAEIKELTTKELIEKIGVDKAQLTKIKIGHAITPLDGPHKISQLRRQVAQLKTVLRQRQIEEPKK